ncbi:MAG: alpha-amylase family glycosyl hydrolase [Bacteroidia bacterium]|nr:alpha-amylase family glycosyl hydrolase [Bacteroidia bacterium]MDG2041254.1 alpha-amylase family glycosyl hydrolase [Bacteroidia bacterium]
MKKIIFFLIILSACNSSVKTNQEIDFNKSEMTWLNQATIYEVNLRQYTSDGTINSFKKKLPKLKELGVDILWFMPIQPIGIKNRKAVGDSFVEDFPNPDYIKYWGSPYSISDYKQVNPRYGTLSEFKELTKICHELDIKVVLDWVANHTAWDNPWIIDHPEWYTHDSTGKITDPIGEDGKSWGWTDVADLNYDNDKMRKAMTDAMSFWIKECDIDGFRCDVAMEVPVDFWNEASKQLNQIKPIFMLAESEAHKPRMFDSAFDAYYGWEMHHVFNKLYAGELSASEIIRVINEKDSICGDHVFPMNFITNHDENSWNGTINERLGESWEAMAVLSYSLRGMPLIYSGQEVGLDHRLSFFEKDSIDWNKANGEDYFNFYKGLNKLKQEKAFSTSSPISCDIIGKDLFRIIRGDSSEYQIILNLNSSEAIAQKVVIPENYEIVLQKGINDNNEMDKWGYLILKIKGL